MKPKLRERDYASAVKSYSDGKTVAEIATSLGVSPQSMYGVLKVRGVSFRLPQRRGDFTTNPVTRDTYHVWRGMLQRCYNKKLKAYRFYGAKGVTVCARWRKSFLSFFSDMGPKPGGMTIDRWPNPAGNYNPRNCRWADWIQQGNNRTDNHRVTFRGRTLTVTQWARELGIHPATLFQRLRKWPIAQAILIPKLSKRDTRHRDRFAAVMS